MMIRIRTTKQDTEVIFKNSNGCTSMSLIKPAKRIAGTCVSAAIDRDSRWPSLPGNTGTVSNTERSGKQLQSVVIVKNLTSSIKVLT